MPEWNRRDVLKAPFAALAATAPAPGRMMRQAGGEGKQTVIAGRERLLLDSGWRFHLGHASDPARDFGYGQSLAPQKTGMLADPGELKFDDSGWRAVDLPHDWAVELDFVNDPDLRDHGFKPLGRRYPATSIGWYRRTFEIPREDSGRSIWVEFDGVFRNCEVAVNGYYLGRNLSGYAPFRYELTDFLNYGGKNVLAVRVDAGEFEGWWYEGAGIYRHVWLLKTHPLHVAHQGTFVTADVSPGTSTLMISTEVDNDGGSEAECRVTSAVVNAAGQVAAIEHSGVTRVPSWNRQVFQQRVVVHGAALWSPEQPYVYRLVTVVTSNGQEVDRYETPFGIRTIRFDAQGGFFLNEQPVKIRGTCNHQDHTGLGVALPDGIHQYRLERLKQMGSNAYRAAHNPPAPELLDAADRLGVLVLDETRIMSSNEEGLSELERMVRRDRNHPSVILWSLGNEESDQGEERGARIVDTMKRLLQRLDPTRPVTVAMNGHWGEGVSEVVDVQGFNYKGAKEIDAFHKQFPGKATIGTEVASTLSTRGIYATDAAKAYFSAYDVNAPNWGSTAESWWKTYAERPFLAGGFVWTGFDYRGEPTSYTWPCISSHFGILDTCGFPKDSYYYYQSWWTDKPVLHLFPHWNWAGREGHEIDVWCYSNLDRVELLLNGTSLGTRKMPRYGHVSWKVKYSPGTLEARGYTEGEQVLTARRETAGEPAAITLHADRGQMAADGEDVTLIEVRVVDRQGRLAPLADNEIAFRVSGSGRLIGVGNGNPTSHEPDKGPSRKAFNGLCQAIVQSTKDAGEVAVEAASPGLTPATIVIPCLKTSPRAAAV